MEAGNLLITGGADDTVKLWNWAGLEFATSGNDQSVLLAKTGHAAEELLLENGIHCCRGLDLNNSWKRFSKTDFPVRSNMNTEFAIRRAR